MRRRVFDPPSAQSQPERRGRALPRGAKKSCDSAFPAAEPAALQGDGQAGRAHLDKSHTDAVHSDCTFIGRNQKDLT